MNSITTQQLNISTPDGKTIVGSLTGEADGLRVNFHSTENPGEVVGSIFSSVEGFFIQASDANGNTLEIDARGLFAFIKGKDAPTWQFPAPKAGAAKA